MAAGRYFYLLHGGNVVYSGRTKPVTNAQNVKQRMDSMPVPDGSIVFMTAKGPIQWKGDYIISDRPMPKPFPQPGEFPNHVESDEPSSSDREALPQPDETTDGAEQRSSGGSAEAQGGDYKRAAGSGIIVAGG